MRTGLTVVWGARCPDCHLSILDPQESRKEVLRALRRAHEEHHQTGGPVDIDHWQGCLKTWELSEVKVTPPVGETVHHPFR